MTKLLLPALLLAALPAFSQQEGPVPTQALVNVEAKSPQPNGPADLVVSINNHKEPLASLAPVLPTGAQVAVLIDDGLRESVGTQLNALRSFVGNLPSGIEILIGYMQNGRVVAQPFATDHAAAAASFHLPDGVAGSSASPYFCLSDFVKHWPESSSAANQLDAASARKARFVLMITNGVDPYNGSTSILNEDSPYVATAVSDAQRAGVAVYSIYYKDAGFRGNSGSLSGQSYLAELADGTGGTTYAEGSGNPVSLTPFLNDFQHAVAETYIATFTVPGGKDLVRLKVASSQPHVKLHAPEEVKPGNREEGL